MMEQIRWGAEFCALLPYAYAIKIWQAHHDFMESLFYVIPRP